MIRRILFLSLLSISLGSLAQVSQAPLQNFNNTGGATGTITSGIPTHFSSMGQPMVIPRPLNTSTGGGVMTANELMFLTSTTVAALPIAQPTALVFTNVTSTSHTVSFTAATGNPAGYIVLRKPASAPVSLPAISTSYSVASSLGDATVAYVGSATTFIETGLLSSINYFYAVYTYNGSDATLNYLTTNPLVGSQTTLSPPPTIASFTPTNGAVGATVIITGTNFSTTATNNVVYFGATMAIVSDATATQLTVTVPSGATYQPISVTVSGLTAYSNAPFIATFANGQGIHQSTFAPNVDFVPGTTGSLPMHMSIGDVDGDGKPDLVVTNQNTNTFSVFRNTSTTGSIATTSFPSRIDFAAGINPVGVALADLDGDGKLDAAVINGSDNTVSIYRNTSTSGSITTGSFTTKIDFDTGTGPNSIVIQDVDGDGKPDLIISNPGAVSVLRNKSTSGVLSANSFSPKIDFIIGSNNYCVVVVDLDGDSKQDLVIADQSGGNVSVFKNTSIAGVIDTNTFASPINFLTSANPYSVATGDLDDDGKQDLAVSHGTGGVNKVSILKNTSSLGAITFNSKVDFTTGSNPNRIAISDIDGDGKPDVATVNLSGNSVSVFKNTSIIGSITTSSFAAKVDFITGGGPGTICIGDLDADGKPDLATANVAGVTGTISILRNLNLALEPTIQSTLVSFSDVQTTSMSISWTAASETPTGYIVLRKIGIAPVEVPVDGTTYSAGNSIGTSTVAYLGNVITFAETALTNNTSYHYAVFSFNGAGTSANYLTATSPAIGSQTTLAVTGVDAPVVSTLSPADNTTSVSPSTILLITFDDAIQKGTGNILIRKVSDNTTVQTIDVAGTNVTISNATLTIDPATDLPSATDLYVNIPSSAIKDLAGNSFVGIADATTWNFSTLTGIDTSPPQFGTNSTSPSVAPGLELFITADFVDDESNIVEALVQYRSVNALGSAPPDILLTKGAGNIWSGTIPATSIGELGVEYKFKIKNGASLEATSQLNKVVVNHMAGITIDINTSFSKSQSNYRIIANPLVLSPNTIDAIFSEELGGYDENVWRMYRYQDRSISKLSKSSTMDIGKGYWFISTKAPKNNIFITGAGTTVPVSVDEPFEITLSPGWNQIGNPYNFNISWNDVRDANPTLSSKLSTTARSYDGSVREIDVIKKFEGAYVSYTGTVAEKIKIPVTKDPNLSRIKSNEIKNPIDSDHWEVKFNLSNGLQSYTLGGLGIHPQASEGVDVYDDFNIPRFFEYLEVKHPKQLYDMSYTKDMVPTQQEHTWNFSTESNQEGGNITLAWDNSYFGNGSEQLWLMDVETGAVWDMRKENKVSVDYSPIRKWRVAFGSEEYVKDATLPEQNSLIAVYPNPFDKEVSMEVAIVESAAVKLDIMDLNGKNVKTLMNQQMNKGRHITRWEGADNSPESIAAGVYIIRFQAGTTVQFKRIVKH